MYLNYNLIIENNLLTSTEILSSLVTNSKLTDVAITNAISQYVSIFSHIPFNQQYLDSGRHILMEVPYFAPAACMLGANLKSPAYIDASGNKSELLLCEVPEILQQLSIKTSIYDFNTSITATGVTPIEFFNGIIDINTCLITGHYVNNPNVAPLLPPYTRFSYDVFDHYSNDIEPLSTNVIDKRMTKLKEFWPDYYNVALSKLKSYVVSHIKIHGVPSQPHVVKLIDKYFPDILQMHKGTPLTRGLRRLTKKQQAYLLGLDYMTFNDDLIREAYDQLLELGEEAYLKLIADMVERRTRSRYNVPFGEPEICNEEDLVFIKFTETNPNDIVYEVRGHTIIRFSIRDAQGIKNINPYTNEKLRADTHKELFNRLAEVTRGDLPFKESLPEAWDRIKDDEEKRVKSRPSLPEVHSLPSAGHLAPPAPVAPVFDFGPVGPVSADYGPHSISLQDLILNLTGVWNAERDAHRAAVNDD